MLVSFDPFQSKRLKKVVGMGGAGGREKRLRRENEKRAKEKQRDVDGVPSV